MAMRWFDGHLDLAYLAVRGRNMLLDPRDAEKPHTPAAVTLPSLADGEVRLALATIFTQPTRAGDPHDPDEYGPESYPEGDATRAFIVGRAQLEVYLTWRDRGLVALDLKQVLRDSPGVGEVRGGMGVAEVTATPVHTKVKRLALKPPAGAPLHLGILMENADPLRSPQDVWWWAERGVVAIGPAWVRGSRYATGNGIDPSSAHAGLTDAGRELIREMDKADVVVDVAHLSDRALADVFATSTKPVIASHSNCRAIIAREPLAAADGGGSPAAPNLQRHLTDDAIKEIARRGGIIGLNLFTPFIVPGGRRDRRATAAEFVAHIEHVCELVGDRRHVGLGSDADGGFAADQLVEGVNAPTDYQRLADALRDRGWDDDDVRNFACDNWARFWAGQMQA